jgi:hypothetical protein
MMEWLEREHWVRTREPFETWLTADGKVEVVHLVLQCGKCNEKQSIVLFCRVVLLVPGLQGGSSRVCLHDVSMIQLR